VCMLLLDEGVIYVNALAMNKNFKNEKVVNSNNFNLFGVYCSDFYEWMYS
jgi:hypothetical protein